MASATISIFQFVVLIFSVMIHEVAHGLVALRLGDSTAKDAGRLTLNPLRHLDPFGSVLLPLMLSVVGSPVLFGWAKPVPYNPTRLRDPRKGAALIGAAGPLSNIVIAVVFGVILRIVSGIFPAAEVASIIVLLNIVVLINVLLAVFNLVPIPPLDGSNILFALLPFRFRAIEDSLRRYGFIILIIFLFTPLFSIIVQPIVFSLYRLITGGAGLL